MDRRERVDDPEVALREAFDGLRAGIWTALPGIIQSFDAAAMTCEVQPSIKVPVRQIDGSIVSVTMPLLVDCPVQFPSGGNCTLTFPVKPGDECLVVFASRCIDAWWQSGGVQEQAELRMHDLSDGFALLGFRSKPRALSGVSTSTAQLRSDAGDTYVDLDPAGKVVKVKAPGGIVLDTPTVTVTGVMAVQNQQGASTSFSISGNAEFAGQVRANGKRIDDSHTHNGVQPGSGNSGTVN
ncbi:Gp138 family membrane-puncturing spike protein [Cupriavidus gilardii]|uniref:Gp138 family membrane-puncturing spike protein n=1 Tax=Cupriavidus gilardii TaxID=82541 RepID=UPI0021BF6C1D|nr:Gp138 family membrane-puncturing spike protein [Cupriavidus gilardii]MCT9056513.1 Gp138 family membrane-puncturing spike protein [Cupriavidus gilardii]WNG69259.1 Gp138 family membrane-puncturing spike protein [Cupriavidus gilardii]